jgi:hypothetical protein
MLSEDAERSALNLHPALRTDSIKGMLEFFGIVRHRMLEWHLLIV